MKSTSLTSLEHPESPTVYVALENRPRVIGVLLSSDGIQQHWKNGKLKTLARKKWVY